ncbi:S8 family peptidase [Calothrix sp. NIES-3974]|uniref:S8 family peptidase n=1 Tax=Calothrix sp. NIES-3974 TaxID=2005462 RepID=UPI000B61CF2E|nr:S8 family peptidase [Calothrix sp. NIES-3974]BAZ07725.1 peptidase S8/S53 [Calothrix sp. NIES-3974]
MSLELSNNYYTLSHQSLNTSYLSTTDNFSGLINHNLYQGNRSYSSYIHQDLNSDIETPTDQLSTQVWDFGWDFFRPDTPNNSGYSSTDGYGLIDASAAVARAINQERFADVPNLGGNNWGADLVNAPSVWARGYTGQGIVVAVLDTGVDRNHEDLSRNIWSNSGEIPDNGIDDDGNGFIDDVFGWNFDANNNNSLDIDGHGTHVAGTIAGGNNGFGVTGIAYDAQIMPVKVLDDNGSGTNSAIAKGIYYAVDNGADVINLSLGGGSYSQEMENAVRYASSRNVIVVMAAGNSGGSQPIYPARYAENYGIAVGAVNRNGNMADFSNRAGSKELTYVTAPGVNIYSTLPNNQYAAYSGTSMATPHVAGVVALMLSANPSLTDGDVRRILTDTSKNSVSSRFDWSVNTSGESFGYEGLTFNRSLALTPGYDFGYDFNNGDSRFISVPRFDDNGLTDRINDLYDSPSAEMDVAVIVSNSLPTSFVMDSYENSTEVKTVNFNSANAVNQLELPSAILPQTTGNGTANNGGENDLIDPDLFNRERDRILLEYRDWFRLLPVT